MKIHLFASIKKKKILKKKIKKLEKIISKQKIFKLLPNKKKIEFNIIIINNKKMKKLNSTFKNKNTTTDVLTFSNIKPKIFFNTETNKIYLTSYKNKTQFITKELNNSEIYISINVAKKQAKENNIKLIEEILILITHGLLHSIGLDHENSKQEKKRMKEEEHKILSQIIPKSIQPLTN